MDLPSVNAAASAVPGWLRVNVRDLAALLLPQKAVITNDYSLSIFKGHRGNSVTSAIRGKTTDTIVCIP